MRPSFALPALICLLAVVTASGCGGDGAPVKNASWLASPASAVRECPPAAEAGQPVPIAFRNESRAPITLAIDPASWSCGQWSGAANPGSLDGLQVPPGGDVVTRSLVPAQGGEAPPALTVGITSGGTVLRKQQLVLRTAGEGGAPCWAAPGTSGCPGFTAAARLPDDTAVRVVSTPTEGPWNTPGLNPITVSPGGPGIGRPWLVTLGDSYMSGIASRWAGNTGGSTGLGWERVDALGPRAYWDGPDGQRYPGCYRSPRGAPAHVGDDTAASNNIACAGATTRTAPGKRKRRAKPGIDFYVAADGRGQLVDLRRFAMTNDVRMIAVSIGGNDFKFAGIVQTCVKYFLVADPKTLQRRLCSRDSALVRDALSEAHIRKVTDEVRAALQRIGTAMADAGYAPDQYTVVVQDYPDIVAPPALMKYQESQGVRRQLVGGCGLWDKDIEWIQSTAVPAMTRAMDAAAASSGLSDVRRLKLAGQYVGHRLCEKGTELVPSNASWRDPGAADRAEWVSQIRSATAGFTPYEIFEGAHRNYWGNLSLRNCLRQVWNTLADDAAPRALACTPKGGTDPNGEPSMKLEPAA